jgi:nickel transport system substrate-binding protein
MFATLDDVKPALSSGSVDMVFGMDTLGPRQFADLHLADDDNLKTYISQPLSTRTILLNSNKPPLNSLAVRKAIIHSIHKQVT